MTEKRAVPIPKGAIFTISTGACSDYVVEGVYRALTEIDADDLMQEWLYSNPGTAEPLQVQGRRVHRVAGPYGRAIGVLGVPRLGLQHVQRVLHI